MFFNKSKKIIRNQGEEIFRLSDSNKRLKKKLNKTIDEVIYKLEEIQEINRRKILQEEKNKRINCLIFNLKNQLKNMKE